MDLIAALFAAIAILAFVALRIASTVAESRASREQSEREKAAFAAASAQGRALEFTAEEIRNLDDLGFQATIVAALSVYLATDLGMPLARALFVAAGYLVPAMLAARWVRLSGQRSPAIFLAALGLAVVLVNILSVEKSLDELALFGLAMLVLVMFGPAVRPLRLTFRHHRLLRLNSPLDG